MGSSYPLADRCVAAAHRLLKVVDEEVGASIDSLQVTEAVAGLIVAARMIDADLAVILHRGAARGPTPVKPEEVERGLKALELELRRITPGWEKS